MHFTYNRPPIRPFKWHAANVAGRSPSTVFWRTAIDRERRNNKTCGGQVKYNWMQLAEHFKFNDKSSLHWPRTMTKKLKKDKVHGNFWILSHRIQRVILQSHCRRRQEPAWNLLVIISKYNNGEWERAKQNIRLWMSTARIDSSAYVGSPTPTHRGRKIADISSSSALTKQCLLI